MRLLSLLNFKHRKVHSAKFQAETAIDRRGAMPFTMPHCCFVMKPSFSVKRFCFFMFSDTLSV